jgi:hypothetical protein
MVQFRSILLFLISTASQCIADATEQESTSSHKQQQRELFDIPSAFDFYSNVCEAHCDGQSPILKINPCPKCKDKYSQEHCNNW